MSYPFKRRLADFFADRPGLNRQALCIYQSLQEVIRLINPPENEHTKRRNCKLHTENKEDIYGNSFYRRKF